MDTEKFGVAGLDELLKGGVRPNSTILIKGHPGLGKTLLALQFLVAGAKKGQKGIWISVEEELSSIREAARLLGIELEKYEKKNMIKMFQQQITLKRPVSIAEPLRLLRAGGIKRVVLDSLTLFRYTTADEIAYRKALIDMIFSMKKVLFLATAEENKDGVDNIKSTAEEYLFDTVIRLAKIRKGNIFEKSIYISKSRGRDHLDSITPYNIKKGGVEVYPKEIPFSLLEKDLATKDGQK